MDIIAEEVNQVEVEKETTQEKFVYRPRKLPLERYQEILTQLKEQFPLLFGQEKVRVMKKLIHLDLRENTTLSNDEIRSFLYQYCNTNKYLKAHKVGAMRYDLQGNEIEEVTEHQVQAKQQILKEKEQQQRQKKYQ